MIQVSDVSFAYPRRPATLEHVNLQVNSGAVTVVLGNNGAGKSTLLRLLMGHIKPSQGTITIDEKPVDTFAPHEFARYVAYVPQRTQPSHGTVYDSVLLGRKPHFHLLPSTYDHECVAKVLSELKIDDLAFRFVDELSGGQQQKVAVGRALASEPQVLILDEPTSSLDVKAQKEVLAIVRQTAKDRQIAVIAVLHDLNQALSIADDICLLQDGTSTFNGPATDVNDEMLSTTFDTEVVTERFRERRIALVF